MSIITITMAGGGLKQQQPNKPEAVAAALRVWEVLDANDRARRAYKRVLARPTMLEVAKNVICLLLWLETAMGVRNVLQEVSGMEMSRDPRLSLLIKEADGLYSYLLDGPDDALPEHLVRDIPTIVSLCVGGGSRLLLDFRFFKFHRDLVARGVAVVRDTVAALVFDDGLHAMLRRFEDDVDCSGVSPRPAPAPELMKPFVPSSTTPPEDARAVFLAFSVTKDNERHGISSQDIIDQFERVYGFTGYIERIEIEQACAGQESKHGIIVFKSPEQREGAMFNETSALFRIKWHDIRMQCYKPPF